MERVTCAPCSTLTPHSVFVFLHRVFTDPFLLDRARMTKTPPMVDDVLDNLNAEDVKGGEEQLFYTDS